MDQYTTNVNEELYNVAGFINKTFCLCLHGMKVENVKTYTFVHQTMQFITICLVIQLTLSIFEKGLACVIQ